MRDALTDRSVRPARRSRPRLEMDGLDLDDADGASPGSGEQDGLLGDGHVDAVGAERGNGPGRQFHPIGGDDAGAHVE